MEARVEEISAGVYRLSISVPDVAPSAGLAPLSARRNVEKLGNEPLSVHTSVWSDKQIS